MMVYTEPGLRGLELWRGIARGATLDQLREQKEEYFLGLREFLVRLHAGEAESADDGETHALRQAAGFARAVLCGGEALHPSLEPILQSPSLPFAIEIDRDGPYAGRRGALEIFRRMRWQYGVALDVGQTQLKVMTADEVATLPRDPELLPFGARAIDRATGRERLRTLVREGLARVARPDGVVLALPVELDAFGVAYPATYPGLFGPVQPIFADLFTCPWVVINDAVLAGLGFPPRRGEKTLVVTLGFGIGGAVWQG